MRFVVSGYYGCGNTGDEAVLAGIRQALARQSGGAAKLTVLSQNPAQTRAQHGLDAVYRMNRATVRDTLRDCDALLSGGGSLLQDVTSVRSLLYYLWVARLALKLGKPVMFYAQGIGPLKRRLSRILVRMVANRADYITVRDAPSARLLASIGVCRPTVEVTADPAFALSPAEETQVNALWTAEGLPIGGPLVGVALRTWGATTSPEPFARLLIALERATGARAVLLPMQQPDDLIFAETVADFAGLANTFPIVRLAYPPETWLGVIARMQAVVAMRLHALIFAARVGTPPFALAYDPKVDSLMNSLGLADWREPWSGFDPDAIAERVAQLIADRAARSASLQAQAAHQEARALRNADCAIAVANRTAPPTP